MINTALLCVLLALAFLVVPIAVAIGVGRAARIRDRRG